MLHLPQAPTSSRAGFDCSIATAVPSAAVVADKANCSMALQDVANLPNMVSAFPIQGAPSADKRRGAPKSRTRNALHPHGNITPSGPTMMLYAVNKTISVQRA
jgi:hypothetical protein